MKLLLWLLQTVAEMVRNLVMAYVYVISKLYISYGRCGVIQDVCYCSRMKDRGWERNNCRSARGGYW